MERKQDVKVKGERGKQSINAFLDNPDKKKEVVKKQKRQGDLLRM